METSENKEELSIESNLKDSLDKTQKEINDPKKYSDDNRSRILNSFNWENDSEEFYL